MTDVAFSENGNTFVTVGNRHVKFWYLSANKSRVGGVHFELFCNLVNFTPFHTEKNTVNTVWQIEEAYI